MPLTAKRLALTAAPSAAVLALAELLGASGILSVLLAGILLYSIQKYAEGRDTVRGIASALMVEAEGNRRRAAAAARSRMQGPEKAARRDVYRGLVASSSIRHFSDGDQEFLHDAYLSEERPSLADEARKWGDVVGLLDRAKRRV